MNDSDDADYEDHASTWRDFCRLMAGGAAFCILVLVAMAVTLT